MITLLSALILIVLVLILLVLTDISGYLHRINLYMDFLEKKNTPKRAPRPDDVMLIIDGRKIRRSEANEWIKGKV